jgi:pyrroline-5-carboxylate reductase
MKLGFIGCGNMPNAMISNVIEAMKVCTKKAKSM